MLEQDYPDLPFGFALWKIKMRCVHTFLKSFSVVKSTSSTRDLGSSFIIIIHVFLISDAQLCRRSMLRRNRRCRPKIILYFDFFLEMLTLAKLVRSAIYLCVPAATSPHAYH